MNGTKTGNSDDIVMDMIAPQFVSNFPHVQQLLQAKGHSNPATHSYKILHDMLMDMLVTCRARPARSCASLCQHTVGDPGGGVVRQGSVQVSFYGV